jgi:hypothetical protein
MRRTPTGTGVEAAEPANTPAPSAPWWLALICIAAGSAIVAGAVGWLPLKLSPGVPRWVGAAAGFVFVLGGIAIALPPRASRLRGLAGAILVTLFTSIAGWIAFWPGERTFNSSVSSGGVSVSGGGSEWVGRIVFGSGAILCAAFAAFLWKRVLFPPDSRDSASSDG